MCVLLALSVAAVLLVLMFAPVGRDAERREWVMRKIMTTALVALLGLIGGHAALAQEPADVVLVTTKTCSPDPVRVREPITCQITATNEGTGNGGAVITDEVLYDTLQPNMTFESAKATDKFGNRISPNACGLVMDNPEYPNGLVQCDFPGGSTLAPDESISMDVTFIPTRTGTLENVAWTGYNTSPEGATVDATRNSMRVDITVVPQP
jgi:hypothetical protein